MISLYQKAVQDLCKKIGVTINGSQDYDIQVHDNRFFRRVVDEQSVGLGESYMDGWWDCRRLDLLFERIFLHGFNKERPSLGHLFAQVRNLVANLQTPSRSEIVCKTHYDLGNDLFEKMLGPSMVYTCGYWDYAHDLQEAQRHKLELACRKMNLKPGQKILDIGCGFGSLLKHAALNYGVTGVGVTLSREQYEFARENCRGLPIEIRLEDYRQTRGKFDRIISIGMFEAVGHKNFEAYMQCAFDLLVDDGAFLLHTIGNTETKFPVNHWVDKYIFPNGYIPSLVQICAAAEGKFRIDDLQNFGPGYDLTLMAWHDRFIKAWPELSIRYDDRFKRMWEFYLLSFAGGFRARHWQLWQIVLARPKARLSSLNEARIFP